jgi:hypothetical protein
MYKITITKNGEISNEAKFETLEQLNAWKNEHVEMGTFQFEDVEVPAVGTVEAYTIPKTHEFQIVNISSEVEAEVAKQAKIEAGKAAREVCQQVLDYVAGENLNRELTIEQITDLQQTFAQAEAALRAGRPTFAKIFISAIEPDEVLVTSEIKNVCLGLLAGY